MLDTIKTNVATKFPEHNSELALSAFIFLRYFVAGISVPESFGISFIISISFSLGLIDTSPDANLRRQLILISKVLSNLSTHVLFGNKEEYMTIMNDFIESNSDSLSSYYSYVSQVSFVLLFFFSSPFHLLMKLSSFLINITSIP